MANPSELLISVGADTSPALRAVNDFARSVKPINLKFNAQPLGTISKDINTFRESLRAAEIRTVAFASAAGQLFAIQRSFQAITKATIETEKSLTDINVVLGLSQKQLAQFSSGLFKVANETGTSFKVAADGAIELSRQGLSATETLKRLKDALTLTRLSGLDVEKSVNAITAAINSFNDATLDSTAIINKLASVDAQFAVSSGDLADSLSRVGSTARDTGVSFDELIGFVTAAKQITQRDGAVIGNALKTIFQRIQRPEVLDNLRELGVLTRTVNGETLGAQEILINLAKTYNTLSSAQQNQVVQLSAGVYQANQFRAILNDLSKENSIYARAVGVSSSATDQAARRQVELNKTLSASINETVNKLTQVSAKVGDLTLKPVFDTILGQIKSGADLLSGNVGESGATVGSTLGEGILKGIGNYLSGPGLLLGGALIFKLVGSFAGTAIKSLGTILETGNGRVKQEEAIRNLLGQQTGLMGEILALGGNQGEIEKRIGLAISQNNAALNQQLKVVSEIAAITSTGLAGRNLGSKPFTVKGGNITKAAVGIIPSIQESIGAIQAGYKPGKIKQLNIPRLGNVVYNDAEKVKYFPGLSQPAIIPPQNSKAGEIYKASFQNAHGFNPYKAEGYIPNYAELALQQSNLETRYSNYNQSISFIPNYFPKISRLEALKLLKSKNFQSLTYQKESGEISIYNQAQHLVRRDKLVGAPPPSGYRSYKEFDESTDSLVLHSLKEGDKEAKFRRFKAAGLKSIRAGGESYDVMNGGFVPNYNLLTPDLIKKVSPEILSTFTKGGNLLKYIRSLGLKGNEGSSRLFLPLTSKIGLKIALNKAGVAQNETEFPILGNDYFARQQYDDILPQGHKYDENNFLYGFVERLHAASADDFRTATGKPKRDFLKDYATTGKLSDIEEKIVDFGRNYDLNIGDFIGGRNVGLGATSSGRFGLKLLDVGANERVMREFYQKRDLGAFGQTRRKIPINFSNEGFTPNFAPTLNLDNYFRNLIESKNGYLSYTVDKNVDPKKAIINNIVAKLGYKGGGVGNELYPLLNKELEGQGINKVFGALINQNRTPTSDSPIDVLKSKFPQLSRGKFAKENILTVEGTDYNLKGGEGFNKDLKLLSRQILRQMVYPKSDGIHLESFLNKGLVPNYSALSAAIKRENAAGIPYSQIRVGSSPAIKSSFNPLGLGVYNTKDEPLGLNQGIQRVAAQGLDPKRAGIPNYAADLDFQDKFLPARTRAQSQQEFIQIQNALKSGLITFKEATTQFAALNQVTKLTPTSFKNLNQSLEAIAKNVENARPGTLNSSFGSASQRYPEQLGLIRRDQSNLTRLSSEQAAKLKIGAIDINKPIYQKLLGNDVSSNLLLKSPQIQSLLSSGVSPKLLGYDPTNGFPYRVNSSQPRSVFLDENLDKKRVTNLTGPRDAEFEKRRVREQARSFRFTEYQGRRYKSGFIFPSDQQSPIQFSEQKEAEGRIRREEIKKRVEENKVNRKIISEQTTKAQAELKFTQDSEEAFRKQSFIQTLNPFSKTRRENERLYGNTQAAAANRNSFQNKAFLASFALPAIGGVGEQAILNLGGANSAAGRGSAKAVGALGTIGSSVLTGAAIGGPVGVGIAALGIIPEIVSVVNAFTDTLPDLQRELEKTIEVNKKTSDSFNGYATTAEQLSVFKGNRFQYNQLSKANALSLSSLPKDTPNRQSIIDAVSNSNFNKARELIGSNEFNQGLLERAKRDNLTLFSDKNYLAGEYKNFTKEDNKKLNAFIPEIYQDPNSNIVKQQIKLNKQTFLKESDFSQIIQNKYSGLLGAQYGQNGEVKNLLDLFNETGLSKSGGVAETSQKIQKDILPRITDKNATKLLEDYVKSLEQLQKVVGDNNLVDKFVKGFQSGKLKDYGDALEKIDFNAERTAQETDSLNKKLLEFSNIITDLETGIETSSIKRSFAKARELQSAENEFALNKSLSNARQPGNLRLSNILDRNEGILQASNEKIRGLDSSENILVKDISQSVIGGFSKVQERLSGLKESSGDNSQRQIISKRIENLTSIFNTDDDIKKIIELSKSGNVDSVQLGILEASLKKKAEFIEEFNNAAGAIEDVINEFSKTKGTSNIQDFYKSGQYSKKLPKRAEELLLSKETEGISPEEIKLLLSQKADLGSTFRESYLNVRAARNNKAIRDTNIEQNFQSSTQNLKEKYDTQDVILSEAFKRDRALANSESQFNIRRTNKNLGFDIQSLGASPLDLNQIKQNRELSTFQEDKFKDINKSFGINIESEQDLNNQIKKQRELIDKLKNTSGPGIDIELKSAEGIYENLVKSQEEINNKIEEGNAARKAANELDRISLQFAENRLRAIRDQNRGLSSKGQGSDINQVDNLTSGLQFTSAEFWDTMSQNNEKFGEDFKNTFKDAFGSAIQNGESLGKALEKSFLNFANNIAVKNVNLALDSIFGAVFDGLSKVGIGGGNKGKTGSAESSILTDLLGSLFSGKANGGLIPKYANGGFVNMGSGVKDDVPALLSGGEYVIRKSSVNKIGKNNLDRINNIKGYASGGSFIKRFNNEFATTGDPLRPTDGAFNIDPNLSSIALTDENNPQNALKFARENYIYDKKAYDAENAKILRKYEKTQKQNAYIAFGSALFNAGLSGYSSYKSQGTGATKGQLGDAKLTGTSRSNAKYLPVDGAAGGDIYRYNGKYISTNGQFAANGGLIRGFANGGVFGAESPMDKYPAMLMGGEYVVKKPVVDSLGARFFDTINKTGRPPRGYADGGYVGTSVAGRTEDIPKYLTELISVSQEIRDTLGGKQSNGPTQSAGVNISVNTNITIAGNGEQSQSTTVTSNQDESKKDNKQPSFTNEDAKKLSDSINAQINQALVRESRSGGIIYERFKTRA